MCWLLSNIAGGSKSQIGILLKGQDIAAVLVSQAIYAEWETRKEAIWAVSNIFTGGNDDQVELLVKMNGIVAMAAALDICGDTSILLVALHAVENILSLSGKQCFRYLLVLFDQAGGMDRLEKLQCHVDHDVYQKAVDLMECYLWEQDSMDYFILDQEP